MACLLTTPACASNDAFCFEEAARRYGHNPLILKAMAVVESGMNPAAVNPTSKAIGVMQIHPQHLPLLSKHGITRERLFDPCLNINIGAWVLNDMKATFGDTWRAVGGYGAGTRRDLQTERERAIYAYKVKKALFKIAKAEVSE